MHVMMCNEAPRGGWPVPSRGTPPITIAIINSETKLESEFEGWMFFLNSPKLCQFHCDFSKWHNGFPWDRPRRLFAV